MDFANRAYNHSYRIDPVVRSLLDTDFYKLLMLQFIWKKHHYTQVGFEVTNRTPSVRLADVVPIEELRAQLDHVRSLRFTESELVWLRGQIFYGQRNLFDEGFLDFLRTFSLPEYHLDYQVVNGEKTGQFVLKFYGNWAESTLWEIYALEILNEMRYRTIMKDMNRSQLDIMYARAKVKLYDKLVILNDLKELNLSDFGTRRRHSFLWQEHCVLTAKEVLGDKFTGTSNAYLAKKHDLEAKGTNAHELPMVLTALANSDEERKDAQYEVLRQWHNVYRGGLLVMLPDTYGTTQFLNGLDTATAMTWKGARPDSKDPIEGGEELIEFWKKADNANAANKLIIFSDGMDVKLPGYDVQGSDIPTVQKHFEGRVQVGFGWGTNLTNDFVGCHPLDPMLMKPASLVCKASVANGRHVVKLSDNFKKATGDAEKIEQYRKIFGTEGVSNVPVVV
jgi:nicotinate phosphoribosyltransferase